MKPLLDGIRVLDLTRVLAGPYCTMILGDLGAEVIKVEEPTHGDDTRKWGPPFAEGGESAYFVCVNRNKLSITLNLKSERGQQILRDLIRASDILIENFRAGTLERWGLDYESLQALRPGLIYCTITGFGYTGPYRDRAGYDFPIQAMGGIMSITGPANGEPHKVGVAVADITTGLFAANAILASLFARERTGEGQRIDMALLDSQVALLANAASNYLISGQVPQRYGNAHPNIVPYQVFKAADQYIAVGVGNDAQYARLCEIVDHPEWAHDPRFVNNVARVANREALVDLFQHAFAIREAAAWLAMLEAAGIPAAPINTIDQVFADPQVIARGMRIEMQHPTAGSLPLTGSPLHIPTAPVEMRLPPPLLGEHTREVLTRVLGYNADAIEALSAEGIV
jgi:crotonobetainyl-CoA:carnitine CoA-transferase CaiB-like acyl-CoA transferase